MHRGTVGFLMNEFRSTTLPSASPQPRPPVHPLIMRARDAKGVAHEAYAITKYRSSPDLSVARLRILIDGKERLAELGRRRDGCDPGGLDGLQSLGAGPIIPINAPSSP